MPYIPMCEIDSWSTDPIFALRRDSLSLDSDFPILTLLYFLGFFNSLALYVIASAYRISSAYIVYK